LNATTSASLPTRDASADRDAYLRHPTLHGDRIAFVADDDLWTVAASGGIARRLTAGLSEPSTPCLSPDGRWLAFVGRDEHHPEVHVMPADGGQARRLTWLGTDTLVRGWTAAGEIAYVTTQGQPFFRNHQGFAVAPSGGPSRALGLGQINHIACGAGGRVAIGRNTEDPARWKRYRGGRAGAIWVDAEGSGTFRRLDQLAGNVTTPLWIGDRLYFLGDGEGVGNLYSCRADGGDVHRHTDHDGYYARQAQSDGRRIVYACGARLWLFDPAQGATTELAIETPAHRTQAARRFVASSEHLEGFKPHPAGHSIAIVARGQLFAMPLWEGAPTRRIDDSQAAAHETAAAATRGAVGTNEPPPAAGRLRRGQWLADGTTMIAASDASGEERLVVFDADGARTLPWDTGHVSALVAAPVGTRVAFANHRNEVWIGDVASGALSAVDASQHGRSDDLAWSPDAAWLAYTYAADTRHVALRLYSVAAKTTTDLTEPEFRDSAPAFDPEGRYLYFVSVRTFDPVYDNVRFDLSFPRAARPYLIALRAGGRPPFDPEPRGVGAEAKNCEPTANGGGKAKPPAAREPVQVDLDGIVRRVAAFPVPEGRYGRIAGVAGAKVVWNAQNIVGAHGRGGHKEAGGKLERFDFATGRTETLAEKIDDFALAGDGVSLVYREGKTLRAIAADRKGDVKPEPADAEGPPSRKNGRIDLDRVRVAIEPRREWRQMLREVWRLQRDQFWSADLSGVDWDAVWRLYAPLLDRVATRADFSDLVWEMQGELGTSHAYETGGDHRKPPAVALGHLAAATRWDDARGGWRITEIARGDAWDASADSPLNAIGVEARVGERIVAVDGQTLEKSLPPEALLVHRAGQKVQLAIASDDGQGSAPRRDVVVTALADDVPVYYRQWVEKNRAWVHERSGGRVGYFHVPDMQAAGFAEFHRYFGNECERDALIVDVRYNRGGHVSQLLLEKVARRRIAFVHSRWMDVSTYPEEAVAGPVVTLTNEHAGSDGDIFSHNVKLMKIGPLVGTRTWGGVVGIWPRHKLVDGSETTQPEFAFWFTDVGFDVENHGTDPDIEVDNAPQDAAAGRDRQLEVALQTALDCADRTTPLRAPQATRPMRARKPLPPRR
jgi:tricorn protease